MYAEPVGALLDDKARVSEFSYSAGQFAVVIVRGDSTSGAGRHRSYV